MFTVLMSVYAGERPSFLAQALGSLRAQSLPPRELVLVQDGPLTKGLAEVIDQHRDTLSIKDVRLPANVGLARALNAGLACVQTPWVARFDSDDICEPHRLARQAEVARQGIWDIFGAQIEEFDKVPGDLGLVRRVPHRPDELLRFAARRNPLNHMTVCFKTDTIRALGGYPSDIPLMEDYALWLRALAQGVRLGNVEEVLVAARVGAGMYERRGGMGYLRSELYLQRLGVSLGLKTVPQAVTDGSARMVGFALPPSWRRTLYRTFMRQA